MFLKGLVTQSEMLRLLQRDTRHFAKRQLTWFRRDPRISWYDIETDADVLLRNIVKTWELCSNGTVNGNGITILDQGRHN
ncbi:MAG: hypothetical protein WA125_11105, partial [Desulfosporosinus sp.]